MKFIKVEWPEVQDYMMNPDFYTECYFDPAKNCWFVPESWDTEIDELDCNPYAHMTDEEYAEYEAYMDGLAGDWEG